MFTAALFTVAKTWKQPKCPLIDNWIKKMWYVHTMECYSALRKDKILPFVTTWIDLRTLCQVKYKTKTHRHKVWWLPEGSRVGVVKGKGAQIYGDRR